jgi:hypothetical protein
MSLSIDDYWLRFQKEFVFQNNKYSLYLLKENTKTIKTYCDSSHFCRSLIQHENGHLFLYEFYEYMNFNGGEDRIYETYTLVKDEADADALNNEKVIKRVPYIFFDKDMIFHVYEN